MKTPEGAMWRIRPHVSNGRTYFATERRIKKWYGSVWKLVDLDYGVDDAECSMRRRAEQELLGQNQVTKYYTPTGRPIEVQN